MSAEARAYLDQVLAIMEQNALYRQEINWTWLQNRTFAQAGNALTFANTYPAIQFALRNLNDSHSFFLSPQQVDDLMSGTMQTSFPDPEGKLLDNGLAYVSVPSFAGSVEAGTAYASRLQQILRKLDTSNPCGRILDLRQNGGGDLWPMLADLGPLLGEGRSGAFVYPDGTQVLWYYEQGQARQGDAVQIQVNAESVYKPTEPQPPVAILTGQGTLSSGEALMVAFRGRPLARSFGGETGGLSTANDVFTLSDGAQIYLTVARYADRTGQVYGGIITPDEYIYEATSGTDIVLEKASNWLLKQENCMTQQSPKPNPDPSARLAPRMDELRSRLEGIEPAVLADRTGSEMSGSDFRLHLWGKSVCLTLPGFTALDAATRRELRPDQEMLLLYYFSTADGTPETGQWISFADLPGGRFYNQAFQGYTGHELAKAFGSNQAAFERAAACLDGRPYPLGDAAFIFHALPRLALLVIFWQGEDSEDTIDFPPSFQILFDSSASCYLPTDACAILGSTLTRRLIAART